MQLNWTGERLVPAVMSKNRAVVIEHMARYKWAMRFCRDKSVVDVACGSGYGCAILAEITSKRVLGIDISKEAIDYCSEKYKTAKFIQHDLEKGYDIKSDIVISFETIEHLNNPEKFLASVKKNCLDTFIFSIPIDLPGEFHKKVYSIEDTKKLIGKHFDNVKYLSQKNDIISNKILAGAKFIIGVAKL